MEERREENVVNFDEVKKEARKAMFKKRLSSFYESAKIKVMAVVEWGREHPAEVAGIVTGASVLAKSVSKHSHEMQEQRHRDREFFDHRTGKWCETKRKLTAREQVEAEARHQAGETWTQIFADMRLLK